MTGTESDTSWWLSYLDRMASFTRYGDLVIFELHWRYRSVRLKEILNRFEFEGGIANLR